MTPEAIEHLRRSDKIMARLIRRVGPCELAPNTRRTPFQALVRSVTFQQLNGTAAETIFGRMIALFPGKQFPAPGDVLATSDERLRSAGLSRAKTAAIKDIAAKAVAGVVPTRRAAARLSDAELVERLTEIRGVGPWTVEMFLIFTLGRPDVWPVADFGVRKGYALTYGLKEMPSPKELLPLGERWRPHRSTAAWYMWRAADLKD
ncbi:MAG: DNA-3-methyladenine glycosylase 2 family protein [Verrucomicrobia bacterium]|nr:MAG: DNA-3-methyladenine glycosylase 2 family protein [Verrucomicrobiota bacterium]